MPSLPSSNSPIKAPEKTPKDTASPAGFRVREVITVSSRLILGGVLALSGFAKAVDPWGGLYKITDYFTAWGVEIAHETSLTLASLLATFEFGLGVIVVMGCYRRAVRWIVPAFMGFMTVLSLYIWIANPVEDCGCFGDAVKVSNSVTFLKNIGLMVPAVFIGLWNTRVSPFVKPALQWIVLLVTFGYIAYIQVVGYHVQPPVDFRPYPVGLDLAKVVSTHPQADIEFIYERDGERRTFDIDNLPDSTWTFVERIEKDTVDETATLSLVDEFGDDVTSEAVSAEGDVFMLIVTDPGRHGISRSEMANRLSEYCDDTGARMVAAVAVAADSLDAWTRSVEARYDVYSAEDTDLKMLARGEAAVVMLRDGIIQWKRNIYSLPPDFPDGDVTPATLIAEKDDPALMRWTFVWLLVVAFTIIIPRFAGHFKHKK